MSYTSRPMRRPVRRKDHTPTILALLTLVALPALGYLVYKLVLNKPAPPAEDPYALVAATPVVPPRADAAASSARSTSGATSGSATPDDVNPYAGFRGGADTPSSGDPFAAGDGSLTSVNAATARACRKIKESVGLGKSLVIWLVDRSPSCDGRREELAQSLETMYPLLTPAAAPSPGASPTPSASPTAAASATGAAADEVAKTETKPAVKPEDAPLLSVVAQFSNEYEVLFTEPTADSATVVSAVKSIQSGGAGNVENTFKAVTGIINQYAEYAAAPHRRYITLVVVTDEVGNDQADRDASLAAAQKYQVPVFVIGQAATFGSKGNQAVGAEGADFQQGPETRELDTPQLESPYAMMSMGSQECGIGPYSLVHLCRTSGGEYYAVSTLGGGTTLPPQMMPRYMSEAEYQKAKSGNKALAALFEAAALPPAKTTSNMRPSFGVDENGVPTVAEVDEAQRPVALVMPFIDKQFEALKKGESDREKLDPRQLAVYDLAYGRIMAVKVRHEGYIVLLAAFKSGRKKMNPTSSTFSLSSAEGIEKNSVLETMAKKARAVLQGVVDRYPNTPWAAAAQQELSQPIGWAWSES